MRTRRIAVSRSGAGNSRVVGEPRALDLDVVAAIGAVAPYVQRPVVSPMEVVAILSAQHADEMLLGEQREMRALDLVDRGGAAGRADVDLPGPGHHANSQSTLVVRVP